MSCDVTSSSRPAPLNVNVCTFHEAVFCSGNISVILMLLNLAFQTSDKRMLCLHVQKLEVSEYDLNATPTFNTDEPESAAHVSVLDDKIYRSFQPRCPNLTAM